MAGPNDFDTLVLPHLDAAYNLARWLVRDDHVAEDMVQDAFIKAFRYFAGFRGGPARPWLLGIVRNTCFTWLEEQRSRPGQVALDDALLDTLADDGSQHGADPSVLADGRQLGTLVDAAIRALAPPFREVVVLREIEGLDYAEIAQVAGIPIGTVMSRLSRARAHLRGALAGVGG
ncbi:MAG: sigma-70 family RNA polymerase sigma factor [Proteobacteria bacterium]|nr:sigma-70 family RNA polymerase sigma factor [Pseudomonadota bacterium]